MIMLLSFAWNKISETIGKDLIGPMLIGGAVAAIAMLREWLKSKKRPFSIRISAEKNDRIQDALLELRLTLKADRAHLNMFHNGSKYIEGSEIMKVSRSNEVVKEGVSFEASHFQNILISLIPDEMRLVKAEGASFTKVDKLEDGKFKRMMVMRGVRAVARCGVNRGKDIIGYVGVDYNSDIDAPINIEELCKFASIIEQILAEYSR
jgi:hypothetical protein